MAACPTTVPQESPQRTKDFLWLIYITATTLSILYAPQPLLTVLAQEFTVSEANAGLAISVVMIPLCIAPIFYGVLLSKIPARTILLSAVAILGLSGIPIYFAESYSAFLAVRGLQGIVIPAVFTAVMARISLKFQGPYLQRAMALYIGATIFGGVWGRVISGFVSTYMGWRFALLAVSLLLLPALYFLWNLKPAVTVQKGGLHLHDMTAVFREKTVRSLMLIEGCTFFVFAGIANLLPFRMQAIGEGTSELFISLMYSTYAVGIVIALYSKKIIAYFGNEIRVLLLGLAIFFTTFIGFLVPSQLVLFVMMLLMCTGQFTEHSIAPGLVNRYSQADKGLVNGMYLATYYGGGIMGSYLPGLVYESFGWYACIALFMVVLFMALLLAFYVKRCQDVQRDMSAEG